MLLAREQASDLAKQRLIIKELSQKSTYVSHTELAGGGWGTRFLEKSDCAGFCPRAWGGQAVLAEEPGITGAWLYRKAGSLQHKRHMPPRKCRHLQLKQVCNLPNAELCTAEQRQRGTQGSLPQTNSGLSWTLRLLSNIRTLHPQVASNSPPFLCQSQKTTDKQTNLYTLPEGSTEENTPCTPKWKEILVNT